jgi:hypothetical protein
MRKLIVGALCAVATTAASATPASASGKHVLDKLYEDIVEEYWIWAFNQPEAVNPLLGNAPFCAESESGRTAFLSGTFLDGPQERSCDVKVGQWLYLSVLSGVYIAFESDPPETKTEEAMLEFAGCPDATATVTVDGYTFNATKSYTETGIFDFPVAEGGLLESLLGGENTDGAAAAGIHVVIPPLPPGEHTISWHAESLDCGIDTDADGVPDEKLIKDLVYTVNVETPRKGRGWRK